MIDTQTYFKVLWDDDMKTEGLGPEKAGCNLVVPNSTTKRGQGERVRDVNKSRISKSSIDLYQCVQGVTKCASGSTYDESLWCELKFPNLLTRGVHMKQL